MRDITLGDTIYHRFTTRAFATGIPTVLAGTPVISAYEENNLTQITAGITLTVSYDSVVGFNNIAIVATSGNGYETGKSYDLVITTGTVGGVSVVGEIVGSFTVESSPVNWAKVTNPTTAVDLSGTDIQLADTVTTLTNLPSITANWITAAGVNAGALDGKGDWNIGKTGYTLTQTFPTNFSSTVISGSGQVDSLVQGFLNTALAETTAGNIAANFDNFYDNANALTTNVVDDVGGAGGSSDWTASEKNEIRGRLGVTGTTAAGGNTPTLSTAASLATAQTDLDTITGSDGVTLATTQGNYAPSKAGDSMDMLSISGDSVAADNLEATYDGTGYTDDVAPATQDQVSGIGSGAGGALNYSNTQDNIDGALKGVTFVGIENSGTNASVNSVDKVYHEIGDSSNAIDIVYEFNIGGGRSASAVVFRGRLTGGNDNATIQAYNGSTWDDIYVIDGRNGSTDYNEILPVLSTHTGTGVDLGLVYIRIVCTAQSNPTLYTDQLLIQGVNIGQTIGYANGRVWVDTVNGTSGTESFVNGVADNPSDTLANAITIAGNLNLHEINMSSDSTLAPTADLNNYNIYGVGYTTTLGGFDYAGTHIFHSSPISGIATTAGTSDHFDILNSIISTVTTDDLHATNCILTGTLTLGTSGIVSPSVNINHCKSGIAGASAPVITKTSGATLTMAVRDWNGGLTISGLESGDTVTLDGVFGTVTLNGADATVEVRGIAKALTNNLTGSPAVNRDGLVIGSEVVDILADTNEIQGDWTNTGRLDTILDTIATDTASIGITKNVAFNDLEFLMVDATDFQTPEIGLTVTGQRSINGAAFANITGSIAEVGSGIYQVDLTSADTNGDVITYKFTATGAADRFITIKTRA